MREMSIKFGKNRKRDFYDQQKKGKRFIHKIQTLKKMIHVMDATGILCVGEQKSSKLDFHFFWDFLKKDYESKFDKFIFENFGNYGNSNSYQFTKKTRYGSSHHTKRRGKNQSDLQKKFLQFYQVRTGNIPNIHILFYLKLVDFQLIFSHFLFFVKQQKRKKWESELRKLEGNFSYYNQPFQNPNEEMLEFINKTIYQMEKKVKNSKFEKYEQELVSLKNLFLLQKLKYEKPYHQSLLNHIHHSKTYYLKERYSDFSNYWYNETYELRNKIFNLSIGDRWAFSQEMLIRANKFFSSEITKNLENLEKAKASMKEKDNALNSDLLKTLDIVAMTTTGACKYRHLLRKVGAQIVMVEEAAEVLESQIVASLSQETKQLILIGDHLQLKPKVNSFTLSEDYGLGISLFERLVEGGAVNVRLKLQRRMRPEISEIVRLIYPDLLDHHSVDYEDVR